MFGCSAGAKGRAGLAGVVGIQGSSHTVTSYHECTLCLIPNNNNFCAAEILAHTYDGLFIETLRNGTIKVFTYLQREHETRHNVCRKR